MTENELIIAHLKATVISNDAMIIGLRQFSLNQNNHIQATSIEKANKVIKDHIKKIEYEIHKIRGSKQSR